MQPCLAAGCCSVTIVMLLLPESSVDRQDSTQSGVSAEEGGGAGPAEPVPDTKKPASVPLPDQLTAMQVDCGTFHTGEMCCLYFCSHTAHILPKL